MASPTLWVIEDEDDIRRLVVHHLGRAGYGVRDFATAEAAWQALRDPYPDGLILDWMLPGMSGLELCRLLKQNPDTASILILMLTALGREEDIVTGLEQGADDYLTKPFSPRVLVARTRALLRRRELPPPGDRLRSGELVFDLREQRVTIAGRDLRLTAMEIRLLRTLLEHPGWVFTRHQIIDAVRGEDYPVTERAVDVQVVGLRKKLGSMGSWLTTIRGVGYSWREPETR